VIKFEENVDLEFTQLLDLKSFVSKSYDENNVILDLLGVVTQTKNQYSSFVLK
jgi:Ni,Fe-hydrogenase I large subunit